MTNTPKLRFKEFSGEWEHKLLSSFATKITQKNGDYKVTNVISNSAKNGLVSQKDYFDKDIANQDNINGYYVINNGDFVYNPRKSNESPYGPINRFSSTEAGVVSPLYLCFSVNCEVNDRYLEYYFKSSKWYQFIYRNSDQGARHDRVSIRDAEFFKMKLNIPNYREQEKIASFFSLIDKKIELQTEKVEELKNYKKGIMQKIFSQELRFKDENGNEYPEWEEVNLRKILKEVSEKTTVINQYEVISSTNNGLYLQKDYFNREIASKDNIGYKILKRNQVVLSPQNLWMGNINLNSKYDIGMVSPSYKIFDIKSEFDSSYIGFILRTDRAFYEYKQASEQGASIVRRNLNMDLFYDISFKLPCKVEQYKISKFINKIDCKIEQEMEKLDSLNQYKKGLLQQMFI